jgi:heat-inducible transcriptional repressor
MNKKKENIINIERPLTLREQEVLSTLIEQYILKAIPVGSGIISKLLEKKLGLSPATIRNVMSELEELNYIYHPHTSSGRIPTDKGYRFYVNNINIDFDNNLLNNSEIKISLNQANKSFEDILKETNRLLGTISNYLSIIKIPEVTDLMVTKLQVISLSSNRLLVVIAFDSNIIKTVTLELDYELDSSIVDSISSYINERVSGKKLSFIKENFIQMLDDFENKSSTLIRLFIDSFDEIFNSSVSNDKIYTYGTQNLFNYPEFESSTSLKSIIEIVENENIIVHLLDDVANQAETIKVLIGSEMNKEELENYSVVMSDYSIGNAVGKIGLIGPKRMHYPKLISIVNQFSHLISSKK